MFKRKCMNAIMNVIKYGLLVGLFALTACQPADAGADAGSESAAANQAAAGDQASAGNQSGQSSQADNQADNQADQANQAAQSNQSNQANQGDQANQAGTDAAASSGSTASAASTMLQLTPLQSGEELAILHTTMGDIKLRFFPDEAPLAVENFLTHAKAGYYDGVIFHRVINEFMIQGGDPDGTGMGGESIWGKGFGLEFSLKLRHFRGALSMAHSQLPDSNGSQFFIVQNKTLDEYYKTNFEAMYDVQQEPFAQTESGQYIYVEDIFPTEVLDAYINDGGTPFLDLTINEDGHTVFGHVVEGMDVVDAIAAVKVGENDKPVTDVVIERISFEIVP